MLWVFEVWRRAVPGALDTLAKFITDIATGQVELPKTDDGKDPAAVALWRCGAGAQGRLKGREGQSGKAYSDKALTDCQIGSQKTLGEVSVTVLTSWRFPLRPLPSLA